MSHFPKEIIIIITVGGVGEEKFWKTGSGNSEKLSVSSHIHLTL
jgi:hypothetical protein